MQKLVTLTILFTIFSISFGLYDNCNRPSCGCDMTCSRHDLSSSINCQSLINNGIPNGRSLEEDPKIYSNVISCFESNCACAQVRFFDYDCQNIDSVTKGVRIGNGIQFSKYSKQDLQSAQVKSSILNKFPDTIYKVDGKDALIQMNNINKQNNIELSVKEVDELNIAYETMIYNQIAKEYLDHTKNFARKQFNYLQLDWRTIIYSVYVSQGDGFNSCPEFFDDIVLQKWNQAITRLFNWYGNQDVSTLNADEYRMYQRRQQEAQILEKTTIPCESCGQKCDQKAEPKNCPLTWDQGLSECRDEDLLNSDGSIRPNLSIDDLVSVQFIECAQPYCPCSFVLFGDQCSAQTGDYLIGPGINLCRYEDEYLKNIGFSGQDVNYVRGNLCKYYSDGQKSDNKPISAQRQLKMDDKKLQEITKKYLLIKYNELRNLYNPQSQVPLDKHNKGIRTVLLSLFLRWSVLGQSNEFRWNLAFKADWKGLIDMIKEEYKQETELLIISTAKKYDCPSLALDITLVLDSSGSVREEGFQQTRDFTQNLIQKLGITAKKYTIINYSRNIDKVVEYKTFTSNQEVQQVCQNIRFQRSTTYTGDAIGIAEYLFKKYDDKNRAATKVMVVVTDGATTGGRPVASAMKSIHDNIDDLYSIAVGVGRGPNYNELNSIGLNPKTQANNVFPITNYKALEIWFKCLTEKLCRTQRVLGGGDDVKNNEKQDIDDDVVQGEFKNYNIMLAPVGNTQVQVQVDQGDVNVYAAQRFPNPNPNYYDFMGQKTVSQGKTVYEFGIGFTPFSKDDLAKQQQQNSDQQECLADKFTAKRFLSEVHSRKNRRNRMLQAFSSKKFFGKQPLYISVEGKSSSNKFTIKIKENQLNVFEGLYAHGG